jgi:DNA-binding transcriptional ArsR family regulator
MRAEVGKAERIPDEGGVEQAVEVLRLLGNAERLRVLCHLAGREELSVGELLGEMELSGSALSQHLAKLRRAGLVATRKERQTVWYRVGRGDVRVLLDTLYGLYCTNNSKNKK